MTTKGLLRTCNPTFLLCFPPHQPLKALNKSQAKGWPHLENLHLQGHYIPRHAAHSFHLGPNLNIDHSSLEGQISLAIIQAALRARSPPQHLCTRCPVHLEYSSISSLQMARSFLAFHFNVSLKRSSLPVFIPSYLDILHHNTLCFVFS